MSEHEAYFMDEFKLAYLDTQMVIHPSNANAAVICLGGKGSQDAKYLADRIPPDIPLYALDDSMEEISPALDNLTCTRGGLSQTIPCPSYRALAELALPGIQTLFISFGLGGAFSGVAAEHLAQKAQAKGIAVVVLMTWPFSFEDRRNAVASETLTSLKPYTLGYSVLNNDWLITALGSNTRVQTAFETVHQWQSHTLLSVMSLCTLDLLPKINLSHTRGGPLLMGYARAIGSQRASEGFSTALRCTLLPTHWTAGPGQVHIILASGIQPNADEAATVERMASQALPAKYPVLAHSIADPRMGDWLYVTLLCFESR